MENIKDKDMKSLEFSDIYDVSKSENKAIPDYVFENVMHYTYEFDPEGFLNSRLLNTVPTTPTWGGENSKGRFSAVHAYVFSNYRIFRFTCRFFEPDFTNECSVTANDEYEDLCELSPSDIESINAISVDFLSAWGDCYKFSDGYIDWLVHLSGIIACGEEKFHSDIEKCTYVRYFRKIFGRTFVFSKRIYDDDSHFDYLRPYEIS